MNVWADSTFLGPVTSGPIYNFYSTQNSNGFWYNNTVGFNNFNNQAFINAGYSAAQNLSFVGDEIKVTYLGCYAYVKPPLFGTPSTPGGAYTYIYVQQPITYATELLVPYLTNDTMVGNHGSYLLVNSAFDTEVYTFAANSYDLILNNTIIYGSNLVLGVEYPSDEMYINVYNVTNYINDGMTHYAVSISNYSSTTTPPSGYSDFNIFYDIAIAPLPEPHIYVLIGSMLALAYVLGRKRVQA
jgi:hypothetical protein